MKSYNIQRAKKILENNDVSVVRVKMSRTHPMVDICDYHSGIDKFGLGKGVYPKKYAPIPPFHPFCRCRLSEMSMSDKVASYNLMADEEFVGSLDSFNQTRVLGSKRRVDNFWRSKERSVLKSGYYDAPMRVGDIWYNDGMDL